MLRSAKELAGLTTSDQTRRLEEENTKLRAQVDILHSTIQGFQGQLEVGRPWRRRCVGGTQPLRFPGLGRRWR